jgi:putative DNA methylase
MSQKTRKKLIEVSIPLEAINAASAREKSIRHGHPSTLHLWWARRPLAACRAVLFAQLVDDPSSWPERFPTAEDQKQERDRLHRIIEAMVPWEASTNEYILNNARWEIARSVAWGLGEEPPAKSDPQAVLAYLQEKAPPVYDPFCGGGSIPLEAQRLGLRAYGSDLNPVAVLISKALVEIPPKFAYRPPVNPARDPHRTWKGAEGLAADVRYYGQWMRDEAEKRIGHLYPKAKLEDGSEATVIAWLWARTVASPDPMARGAHVPLVSSFMLSTKKDRKAWVEVVRDPAAQDGWRFEVKTGSLDKESETAKKLGTKAGKAQDFLCILTGTPIPRRYIQAEGKADRLAARLMAIVANSRRGRIYLAPTANHAQAAAVPEFGELVLDARSSFLSGATPTRAMITGGVCSAYGLRTWGHLFTDRQLVALTTFSDLIGEARERVLVDARAASLPDDPRSLADDGAGTYAYADAVATYLSMCISRQANRTSSICFWDNTGQKIQQVFARQALPMTWDFVESNPLGAASGCFTHQVRYLSNVVATCPGTPAGKIYLGMAQNGAMLEITDVIISTDPPYYDNIGYADLSDFFYVWLRRSLRAILPDFFRRVLTPKTEELVATPHRHGGQQAAADFFMRGMSRALENMVKVSRSDSTSALFYAFKQSEVAKEGLTSQGWATFLQAIKDSGFLLDGTWPVRTELTGNLKNKVNALASSIVLVCTKRPATADMATRREFIARLKREMPDALQKIKESGVGPVDMAQSALGPGMGIFTSYAKVLEPDDSEMTVRTAIALINEVREEILGEEDADYDAETRFCLDWFQAFGMSEGKAGDAIGMANAYNLGLGDLERAGVFHARGGVARLRTRAEMSDNWQPSADTRLTHWECTQHLIRVLQAETGGADATARLLADMRPEDAEAARALAYRLYDICEKQGWAQEAQAYNLLAQEFPHLEQTALHHAGHGGPAQEAFAF